MKKWAIFIDGRPVTLSKSEYLPVYDKATGQILAGIPACSADYADLALQSARLAFEKWSRLPPQERAKVLHQAAHVVRVETPGLARLLLAETGRSPSSVGRELRALVDLLDFFAEEGLRLRSHPPGQLPPLAWTLSRRAPVGVVAALLSADWPLLALGQVLAPALAAGCAVVAKPAPATPLASLRLAALLGEAGLPAGLFNVVTGPGEAIGRMLTTHGLTGQIAFSGEPNTGRQVAAQAAQGDKPILLEPCEPGTAIFTAEANLAEAVPAFVKHCFLDAGQHRNRINRLFVQSEVYAEVTSRLAQVAAEVAVTPNQHSTDFMGPLVKVNRETQLQRQLEVALGQGAGLLCGGQRLRDAALGGGCYWPPTILIDTTPVMPVMRGVDVGPLLAVMKAGTLAEAIQAANACGAGKDAVIFSQNLLAALSAAEQLCASSIWLNRLPPRPGGGSAEAPADRGDLLPESWGISVEGYLAAKQIHLSV